MSTSYEPNGTALLFVDPCTDFLSPGGKLWDKVEPIARELNLLICAPSLRTYGRPQLKCSSCRTAGYSVAKEYFGCSAFANTDLDYLLKQQRVVEVIVVGLLANTCIEGTSCFASELGYRVTLVKDATATFSHEALHAADEVNATTYAHAVLTTSEVLQQLGAAAASAAH